MIIFRGYGDMYLRRRNYGPAIGPQFLGLISEHNDVKFFVYIFFDYEHLFADHAALC